MFLDQRRDGQVQTSPWLRRTSRSPRGLVEEARRPCHDVAEEDVGRLAAELERHRDQVLGRVLHDLATRGRLAGEGDLGHARADGQRLAGLEAEAVDDVEHAGGQQVGDQLGQHHDRRRRLLGRLEHHALPAASAGASFQAAIRIGKFQGMICPTTPSGSWKW
jgi:hypothetical protein